MSLAITCVSNAERTLNDFLDFLKNDKYRVWNQDQISKRDALLKSMIGEHMDLLTVLRIRIILIRIRIQDVKKFVTDPDPGKNYTDPDPDPAKKA